MPLSVCKLVEGAKCCSLTVAASLDSTDRAFQTVKIKPFKYVLPISKTEVNSQYDNFKHLILYSAGLFLLE